MTDRRVEILAGAFFKDPLFVYFWPDEKARYVQTRVVIEFFLSVSANTFCIDLPDGDCAGVLGAFAPGEYPPSFLRSMTLIPKLVSMILKSLRYTPMSVMAQLKTFYQGVERMRPKLPHWYIVIVGVDPRLQGKGIGAKLLEEVFVKAREQAAPVYLECSNPRSLEFYAKHGFEIEQEMPSVNGCPTVWGLIRKCLHPT